MSKVRNTHKNASTTIVLFSPAWRARATPLNDPFRQNDLIEIKLKESPFWISERDLSGAFSSAEEAIAEAKRIVDRSLRCEEPQETIIESHGLHTYVRKILDNLYINSYI